jgi:hypothetical protein
MHQAAWTRRRRLVLRPLLAVLACSTMLATGPAITNAAPGMLPDGDAVSARLSAGSDELTVEPVRRSGAAVAAAFPTTTSLQILPAAPRALEQVTFQAKVEPAPPPYGSVVFRYSVDGGADQRIGSPLNDSGIASWTFYTPALVPGHYVVVAVFEGQADAEASSSGPVEFTISPLATVTTLALSGVAPLPGEDLILHASATYALPLAGGYPNGPFTLFDVTGQDPVEVATSPGCTDAFKPDACSTAFRVPGMPVGRHRFRVHFEGDAYIDASESDDLEVTVSKGTPSVELSAAPNPVQVHHDVYLTASLNTASPNAPTTGTLIVREVGSATVLGQVGGGGSWLQVAVPQTTVGTRQYEAVWSGNEQFTAGSAQAAVQVAADVVEATSDALSYTTFHPVKDGYRDTVTARGMRAEPVAVEFTVRNSSGKVVRRSSLGAATGSYSWQWNGRDSAAKLVAAGAYAITRTLRDAAGTTKVVRQAVTVSRKRLHWYSTNLYKTGSQTQKSRASWGAWQFRMPSGVAYRSLRLYVYGRASSVSFTPAGFAPHDRRACSYSTIGPGCRTSEFRLTTTNGWASGGVSPTYQRNGRYVRAYVWAGTGGGRAVVYRLRLRVSYALLK